MISCCDPSPLVNPPSNKNISDFDLDLFRLRTVNLERGPLKMTSGTLCKACWATQSQAAGVQRWNP